VSLRRHLAVCSLALFVAVCAPGAAAASQTAKIAAAFRPEHLGAATTLSFNFDIRARQGVPAPLTAVKVDYPPNLGFATSGLGIATCSVAILETLGPESCPSNSQMGYGSAHVEIPLGPEVVGENVQLAAFAGPSSDGYLHLLIAAIGKTPVIAVVVMSGVLLPGQLQIVVPPIPSLPKAPYVAVSKMRLTLGGKLVYHQTIRGVRVAYRPPGVGLPTRCPHGGFAFAASFKFLDGSSSGARTAIPCPR
jgi:hypothetical protein